MRTETGEATERAGARLANLATRSDDELVTRAAAGELAAFELLVERHSAVAVRVAARIVGEDRAEDVAQDAFLRAFHRLPQFRGDAPFRAWLLRITHNVALNALARERYADEGDEGLAAQPETARGPSEQLELSERQARLLAKLGQMTPAHRAVLVLRDLEDLTYDEIAAVTDSPLGTVKGRLHRARRELIELLRRNTYDWGLPRERD